MIKLFIYIRNNFQETALLTEIGLAENPLTLRTLWDTKSSTSTANNASSNIGRPMFPASINLTSKPCASVSFSSAPDIFVRNICNF